MLVAVNGDEDSAKALHAVAKRRLPWRSFWDDRGGANNGPIARAWDVRFWPAVYVVDHGGVIRRNKLGGEDLDAPLAQLISEAEAKQVRGAAPELFDGGDTRLVESDGSIRRAFDGPRLKGRWAGVRASARGTSGRGGGSFATDLPVRPGRSC